MVRNAFHVCFAFVFHGVPFILREQRSVGWSQTCRNVSCCDLNYIQGTDGSSSKAPTYRKVKQLNTSRHFQAEKPCSQVVI